MMTIVPWLEIQSLTVSDLLSTYAAVLDELRQREVVRSSTVLSVIT